MPLYEFHCEQCDADSEILVRAQRSKGTACPKCGSTRLTKKFSVFASSVPGNGPTPAACTTQPSSCCACGTGRPHRH